MKLVNNTKANDYVTSGLKILEGKFPYNSAYQLSKPNDAKIEAFENKLLTKEKRDEISRFLFMAGAPVDPATVVEVRTEIYEAFKSIAPHLVKMSKEHRASIYTVIGALTDAIATFGGYHYKNGDSVEKQKYKFEHLAALSTRCTFHLLSTIYVSCVCENKLVHSFEELSLKAEISDESVDACLQFAASDKLFTFDEMLELDSSVIAYFASKLLSRVDSEMLRRYRNMGKSTLEWYCGTDDIAVAIMEAISDAVCGAQSIYNDELELKNKKIEKLQEKLNSRELLNTKRITVTVDNPEHVRRIDELEDELADAYEENGRLQDRLYTALTVIDTYKKYQVNDDEFKEYEETAISETEELDISSMNILIVCKDEFKSCFKYDTYDYNKAPKRVDIILNYDLVVIILPSVEHKQTVPVMEYCRRHNKKFLMLTNTNNDAIDLSIRYYIRQKGLV